jgi:hypothetical protein
MLAMMISTKPALAYTYSGARAASYADQWWNSYNSYYTTFPDDCTNFVSQALAYGGKTNVGQPTSDPNNDQFWFYFAGGIHSRTWTVSANLMDFLGISNYGYDVNITNGYGTGVDSAQVGDVLFYAWQGTTPAHASIQVVENGTDPTYGYVGSLVDQHTNPRYHEIWSLLPTNSYAPSTEIYEYHINP